MRARGHVGDGDGGRVGGGDGGHDRGHVGVGGHVHGGDGGHLRDDALHPSALENGCCQCHISAV